MRWPWRFVIRKQAVFYSKLSEGKRPLIDFVRGTITYIEADYAVVDVGQIGYRVYVSNPYAAEESGSCHAIYTSTCAGGCHFAVWIFDS